MLAREYMSENADVAGYGEAFRRVLSLKPSSIRSSYLRIDVLGEPRIRELATGAGLPALDVQLQRVGVCKLPLTILLRK